MSTSIEPRRHTITDHWLATLCDRQTDTGTTRRRGQCTRLLLLSLLRDDALGRDACDIYVWIGTGIARKFHLTANSTLETGCHGLTHSTGEVLSRFGTRHRAPSCASAQRSVSQARATEDPTYMNVIRLPRYAERIATVASIMTPSFRARTTRHEMGIF